MRCFYLFPENSSYTPGLPAPPMLPRCSVSAYHTPPIHKSRNKYGDTKATSQRMQRGPKVLLCPSLATSEGKALEQDTKPDPKSYSDLASPELQAARMAFGSSNSIL